MARRESLPEIMARREVTPRMDSQKTGSTKDGWRKERAH
jgi:hypothetical protein